MIRSFHDRGETRSQGANRSALVGCLFYKLFVDRSANCISTSKQATRILNERLTMDGTKLFEEDQPLGDATARKMRDDIQQHFAPSPQDDRLRWIRRGLVAMLLLTHAFLVGWQSWRWSPTVDEVAHLPSGIAHWKFGTFDLYRVNPPLIRIIAASPMLLQTIEVDWSSFSESPYARSEFSIGHSFVRSNGHQIFWYFTLARWACLPVSMLGGWICYCWARECFGTAAGFVSLVLYVFCPNILGYASLITPDLGAAAFGVWASHRFWRWLHQPTAFNMVLAGVSLGLAELTKSTWVVLFGLWPACTLVWTFTHARSAAVRQNSSTDAVSRKTSPSTASRRWLQLCGILFLGLNLLNLGYGFEKSFQRLDRFQFVSHALGGADSHRTPGNRFAGTLLGALPVPVPANYLTGIDVQRFDFERGKWSYLCCEQKLGGWWYYYIYAMAVKVPLGTILLFGLAGVSTCLRIRQFGWRSQRDNLFVLVPALTVLVFVSSQTGFSRYMRYVLPMFPFVFIWISQVGCWFEISLGRSKLLCRWQLLFPVIAASALLASVGSSLAVWPHSLSYFNESAGGPKNGHRYLLDANIDWGQDLLYFQEWVEAHPESRPLYFSYFGFVDPKTAGLDFKPVPSQSTAQDELASSESVNGPLPGWHAVSINELYGYKHLGGETDRYAYLRRLSPVARCGYSILIFHLSRDDVHRLRLDLGLSPLISK